MKKIAVLGTGYVGLVTGACLADMGHKVYCADIDKDKIEMLNSGQVPIFEPGIDEKVKINRRGDRLFFTSDCAMAISRSSIIFIAVGTPAKPDGKPELKYVKSAARTIAENLNSYKIIVNKSTVPVGMGNIVRNIILNYRKKKIPFDVCSNPEFLREGSAITDFMHPDRIVIGVDSRKAERNMREIYRFIDAPILVTNIESAEMIKYASNAFLALKISFVNELSLVCERVGSDVLEVTRGMGLDQRIGPRFLSAGIGYGGSCFPKDTLALCTLAKKVNLPFKILKAAVDVNEKQKGVILTKLTKLIGNNWKKKRIGLLGLSFKPNTDDIRDAPSLFIIKTLLKKGVRIAAYDPISNENVKKIFPDVDYKNNPYEVALDADALMLLTEWNEFKELNMRLIVRTMRKPVLLDGRNMYSPEWMRGLGFKYESIGRA